MCYFLRRWYIKVVKGKCLKEKITKSYLFGAIHGLCP